MQDCFPDLMNICPIAFGDYLDSRILKPSWGLSYTKGELKKPDGCDFGVISTGLSPNDP